MLDRVVVDVVRVAVQTGVVRRRRLHCTKMIGQEHDRNRREARTVAFFPHDAAQQAACAVVPEKRSPAVRSAGTRHHHFSSYFIQSRSPRLQYAPVAAAQASAVFRVRYARASAGFSLRSLAAVWAISV